MRDWRNRLSNVGHFVEQTICVGVVRSKLIRILSFKKTISVMHAYVHLLQIVMEFMIDNQTNQLKK